MISGWMHAMQSSINWFALVIFAAMAFVPPVFSQSKPADRETYPVRIILEPRPDARFYQIEWLERGDISEKEEAPPEGSMREKITRTEIRRTLPVRYRYFRLRSAYRDDLFGPWGKVIEIPRPTGSKQAAESANRKDSKMSQIEPAKKDAEMAQSGPVSAEKKNTPRRSQGAIPVQPQDVFAQVVDKEGNEKWVLRGMTVAADRLVENNPLWYDVECLSEKDAPENTNGRLRYNGPIPFTRAGQYRMNLYNTDDAQETQPIQTWIFWVYTDLPRTNAKFYAPFLHGRGGFIVGGKTRISLHAEYSGAAIDRIEYRIFAEGKAPGTWQKYEDEIEVASFAQGQYGYYSIEYRATNVAGNTEAAQIRRILVDARGPAIEEHTGDNGGTDFTFSDENYPIVVRIYQNDTLVQDIYFKQWKASETVRAPAQAGYEIRAIDLLGNETIMKK